MTAETAAEIFRLQCELAASKKREAMLSVMLQQKNTEEDRLRALVNELQLSLELSRLDAPSSLCSTRQELTPSFGSSVRSTPPSVRTDSAGSHCSTCKCWKSPMQCKKSPPPGFDFGALEDDDDSTSLRHGMKRLRIED